MTYASWYARTESGLAALQRSLIDIESGVTRQRAWNPELVIGLAQTEDYARAVLTACIGVLGVPNDLDEVVAARMQRQLILDREPHTFEFLIGEWALHRTVGSAAVMRAQIKALIDDLDSRPNLRIGIVALSAEFVAATLAFVIHDSSAVEIETVTGEVIATRPDDIALAERTFALLQNQAVYGDDARVLLTRALATHTD
ncbi:hypothetical protein ATM97_29085 [Nocardia sp. MH4]|uniref:DUF5753 domain-containing protein n=1 Tax=Nocardia fluminea TaxID=134984 RepID=A0A2N3VD31_9NOCA|nr:MULTISPECIES: DUF5753 domain-containing protein [Nocardia]MBW0275333.1 hypothetical protein [Nocardia sp. MH4]PKV79542.1 hypothetical protein ATK86_3938 [Nocardia fluminea]